MRRLLCAALLFLGSGRLYSQEADAPTQIEGSGAVVRFGSIVIDKEKKSVTFPGALNLTKGALEYLLVTEMGKTHESLLSTKVRPYDLQVAMLLLGVKPDEAARAEPPAQINRQYLQHAPELRGPKVDLYLSWHDQNGDHRLRAEDLIMNTEARAPMTDRPLDLQRLRALRRQIPRAGRWLHRRPRARLRGHGQ